MLRQLRDNDNEAANNRKPFHRLLFCVGFFQILSTFARSACMLRRFLSSVEWPFFSIYRCECTHQAWRTPRTITPSSGAKTRSSRSKFTRELNQNAPNRLKPAVVKSNKRQSCRVLSSDWRTFPAKSISANGETTPKYFCLIWPVVCLLDNHDAVTLGYADNQNTESTMSKLGVETTLVVGRGLDIF